MTFAFFLQVVVRLVCGFGLHFAAEFVHSLTSKSTVHDVKLWPFLLIGLIIPPKWSIPISLISILLWAVM